MLNKMLRPDSRGRITLGSLAGGVSGFVASITKEHKILLTPYEEIPARERWLYDNKEALASVMRGLEDSAAGRVSYLGSFEEYADEEID
jgi:hypothetical protein